MTSRPSGTADPAPREPRRARRRPWLLPAAGLLLIVLIAAGLLVYQAYGVRKDLRAAQADATGLQTAVADGDGQGAKAMLARLQKHSGDADDTTGGFLWSIGAHLPMIGDDLDAVRAVSGGLDEVSTAALPPLVDVAQTLTPKSFSPNNGRVDVERLKRLAGPVSTAVDVLGRVGPRLDRIDTAGLLSPLRDPVARVQAKLDETRHLLGTADTALHVLPPMLGDDGPRRYLVVFQNNAEIRSTGGLLGAFAEVSADHGEIKLLRQGAGSAIAPFKPRVPLTPEELALFQPQMGEYFVDANFTPDFPRTAELVREMWKRQSGRDVDGVISLDPVGLSYVLKGTGPVKLADGSELTAANVVQRLLNQVYFDIVDTRVQDAYFASAAKNVFEAITSGQGDPKGVLSGFSDAAAERRLMVWSFDKPEKPTLETTPITGALPTGKTKHPQVGVYLSDLTGAKMQYYLDYDVAMKSESCTAAGVQTLHGTVALKSSAPKDPSSLPPYVANDSFGTEAGSQLLYLRLYGSAGGKISDVRLDGKKVNFGTFTHDGRPVARVVAGVAPQQTVKITFTVTTGGGQGESTQVQVTPGVQSGSKDVSALSSCG